jgi:hypothetical protein
MSGDPGYWSQGSSYLADIDGVVVAANDPNHEALEKRSQQRKKKEKERDAARDKIKEEVRRV